jgi:GNAT superfamily N-acetyltransferase
LTEARRAASVSRLGGSAGSRPGDPRPAYALAGHLTFRLRSVDDPLDAARSNAAAYATPTSSAVIVPAGCNRRFRRCQGFATVRVVRIAPLERGSLPQATAVLAEACVYDRAAEVADEKLFGAGPSSMAQPFGAWHGDALVGVAALAGNRIRVIAVAPSSRRSGAGSGLLDACCAAARAAGVATVRTLDQPGNYLAPGIDDRNTETLGWLERRGFRRLGEPRINLLVDVRDNPRVSAARASELAAAAAARGYTIRRARSDERALVDAVAALSGGAWPFEIARALGAEPPGVHVATKDGAYAAFAAHDGNNRGLGWFGPTETWPAHRGQGLGAALLLACLVDVAAHHARCEIAWIGPRAFYDKIAGIVDERRFVVMARDLG